MNYNYRAHRLMLHEDSKNPKIEYFDSGQAKLESWYQDGELHREGGPARTRWWKNGNLEYRAWYRNGERHREGGPAYIGYYKSGELNLESWRINDGLHRFGGPAYTKYYPNGEVALEEWFYQGNGYESEFDYYSKAPFTEEDFNKILARENSPQVLAALYRNPNFPGDPDEWMLGG